MTLAAEIARFYGQGKEERNGDAWLSLCPVHGDSHPSLSVKDKGNGDVDVYCHTGCDFKEIKDRFRADGLLPEWKPERRNGERTTTLPPAPEEPKVVQPEKPSFIWTNAGTDGIEHAKKYLAGRGITIDPLPVCLRWNSYKDKEGQEQNLIVAAASCPEDTNVYAVQRLFIDLADYKKTGAKMHGPCDGRGVWFDRKADKTEIVIGEGIETVLSVIQATGKNGVAALSTSGMKGLIIPEETTTIYILVDSDPARRDGRKSMPGQEAAVELAKRFVASRGNATNRVAYLVTPDDTCFSDAPAKFDFNDLLQADPTGESIRARFEVAQRVEEIAWAPAAKVEAGGDGGDGDDYYPAVTMKALHEMNKEFAAVLLGGDFRIAREGFENTAGSRRHTLSFLKKESFHSFYLNKKFPVPVGENKIEHRPISKIWFEWPGRREYKDVVFDPNGRTCDGVYNLFRGFPIQPQKGDWSKMRAHIFEVICDSNPEHFEYLMAWMARIVQHPGGQKPGVAVVLKGGKGIGKGQFVNYFGKIFGEAFLPISDSESFTGRFNMHLSKSILVFLDEAVWGGDKRAEGKLKQLITESTILFEPKGIDSMTLKSYLNVIIASNEEWVVPATGDERRFFVLKPSDKYRRDSDYFNAIKYEREHGGVEAMMHDLLEFDISKVNLWHAPDTEGLQEQVSESLPSTLEFWRVVLERGYMLSDRDSGGPVKSDAQDSSDVDPYWPELVFKHEVWREYENWRARRHERYACYESTFWKATMAFWPPLFRNRTLRKDKSGVKLSCLRLPETKTIRAAFTAATKITFEGDVDGVEHDTVPFTGQF